MMKMTSWIVGLGVLALALVGWAMPKRRKNTWEKAVAWTSNMSSPVTRMVMRTGKKMIRGMVR